LLAKLRQLRQPFILLWHLSTMMVAEEVRRATEPD
jgi:hypothetical protein